MKYLAVFVIVLISFANCEEEFGQRISKNSTKTTPKIAIKSTNSSKESAKPKDLDTHDTVRTYDYALAPFEVQSHHPKVIAEEHTLHDISALGPELAPLVAQAVHANQPVIHNDNPVNYAPAPKSLYGAHRMPKHYGTDLPIYKDDPKEHLKGYLPIPLEPALPMHAFSQTKPEINSEVTAHSKPVGYASALPPSYVAPIEHREPVRYELDHNLVARHQGPARYEAHGGYEEHGGHGGHGGGGQYASYGHLDHIPGIPGSPWKDYPTFHSVPYTNFKCQHPGYYADVEAGCQVWHYCQLDGRHDRFLCNNGTLFNQKTRVCDWWYNVDCHSSVLKYGVNQDLYRVPYHKYLPQHPAQHPKPPQHQYQLAYEELPAPHHYPHDLHDSGPGLLYASESQTVPKKQHIRRVHRIRTLNKTNSTDSGVVGKKSVV